MLSIDRLVEVLLQDEAKKFNVEARLFFRYVTDNSYVFTLFETDGGLPVAEAKCFEDKLKLLFLAIRWQRNLSLVVGSKDGGYSEELPPVLIWGGQPFEHYYLEEALGE